MKDETPPGLHRLQCRGGTLVIVMALVVILGFVGAAILNATGINGAEAGRRHQSLQAFWAAESGIQNARHRILNDQTYRNTPTILTGTNGSGTYWVSVSRTGNVFNIYSAGTGLQSRVSRRLTQKLQIAYGTIPTNFAIFVDHATVEMKQFTFTDGSIFSWGDVTFWQDAAISGTAYGSNYEGNPDVEDPSIIQPPPQFPPLDTTYYDDKINYARTHDSGLNLSVDVNLAGQTYYVTGDWYHTRATRVTSTPPGGTLVVSGDVILNKDGIIMGPNVNLICGGRFVLMKSASFRTNCNIFASGGVDVKQSGTVFAQSSLVTPSQIDCQHTIEFNGLLYCGGPCNLYQYTEISGLVYAKSGMWMDQHSRVNWAPHLLPPGWPRGISTNVTLTIIQSDWAEI